MPTHPGWNGTERPAWLTRFLSLLACTCRCSNRKGTAMSWSLALPLVGGLPLRWRPQDDAHLITGLVIIDGTGVEIEGQPIRDFYALDARGIAEYSYHDPDRFYVDPATVPPEQAARQRANIATMRVYAGEQMYDRYLAHSPWTDSDTDARALGGQRPHRHASLWASPRRRDPQCAVQRRERCRPSAPLRAATGDLRRARRLWLAPIGLWSAPRNVDHFRGALHPQTCSAGNTTAEQRHTHQTISPNRS